MTWNNFAFISLVCALLSTASAILILSAKRRGPSLLFGLIAVVLAVWSFCLYGVFLSQGPESALFWARSANYIVLFLPALLFHFVASFVGKKEEHDKLIFSYYLFSCLYLSTIVGLPDSFLHTPTLRLNTFWFPIGGSLFYLFPLLFTCIVGHSLYVLMLERVDKDRTGKLKLDYLISTIGLGFLGGGLSLSLEFEVNIPPYGILCVAFMVIISTYAVMRHDLLELPETLSLVITRMMIYICIAAFVVFILKGGVFFDTAMMSVAQVTLLVGVTLVSCEVYAFMKKRLQKLADNFLVKQKLETERQFRELMHQLDSSDDFESMLPIMRRYFERQVFVHHYAWYLETDLLDRTLSKKKLRELESDRKPQTSSFQRILFSATEGRRHDRLPVSIGLDMSGVGNEGIVKDLMVTLLSSEQLDEAYDWVERVPGREMLGLPIIANAGFRGILLVVVSKTDIRYTDQARLQALSAKLGRLVERVEFFRRESKQEQLYLHRRMQSLQALASHISQDMQEPLQQMREFVRDVALDRVDGKYDDYMDFSCHRARAAIARGTQVIDMSLDLVSDDPIDVSDFKVLSIQNVVSKALADYVFISNERARLHCDLRHDFSFKGDEALFIRTFSNIIRYVLGLIKSDQTMDASIISEHRDGKSLLCLRTEPAADKGESIEGEELERLPWQIDDLCVAYCERVMASFGGTIRFNSEENPYCDIQLSFPHVFQSKQTGYKSDPKSLSAELS